MLRLEPRTRRKARAGPRRRYGCLGADEGAVRGYFPSGPHVFFVRTTTLPPAHSGTRTTADIKPSAVGRRVNFGA